MATATRPALFSYRQNSCSDSDEAASIPVAIVETLQQGRVKQGRGKQGRVKQGRVKQGGNVLMVGFGGGLTRSSRLSR